jgi:hypothetical protein
MVLLGALGTTASGQQPDPRIRGKTLEHWPGVIEQGDAASRERALDVFAELHEDGVVRSAVSARGAIGPGAAPALQNLRALLLRQSRDFRVLVIVSTLQSIGPAASEALITPSSPC